MPDYRKAGRRTQNSAKVFVEVKTLPIQMRTEMDHKCVAGYSTGRTRVEEMEGGVGGVR